MKKKLLQFRAWVKPTKKEKGEMFNVIMITFPVGGEIILSGKGGSVSAKDCKLMQYTGRKDRNRKKIFEDDIVQDNSGAVYIEGLCGSKKRLKDPSISINDFEWEEVMGNVHENKNLLK